MSNVCYENSVKHEWIVYLFLSSIVFDTAKEEEGVAAWVRDRPDERSRHSLNMLKPENDHKAALFHSEQCRR